MGETMKSLQDLIMDHTNADGFFETIHRPHMYNVREIDFQLNIPNLINWVIYKSVVRYPDHNWPEHWIIQAEENLIHPRLAIQTVLWQVLDVLKSVDKVHTDTLIMIGYLGVARR